MADYNVGTVTSLVKTQQGGAQPVRTIPKLNRSKP